MTHPALIERITRSLAYMLRHQPEEFDLEVDEHGFAELEDVVRALNERLGEAVEEDDVRDAVGGGDRQRYEIVGSRIRALYGHSIEVLPGEPAAPPAELFVGVSSADADRARRHGLRAGRRRFLHLALSPEDAIESGRRVAHDYVVITVRAGDAWEEGINFYDRRSLFLSDPIPTEFLEVGEVRTDGFGEDPRERGGRREERGGRREERGHGRRSGGGPAAPRREMHVHEEGSMHVEQGFEPEPEYEPANEGMVPHEETHTGESSSFRESREFPAGERPEGGRRRRGRRRGRGGEGRAPLEDRGPAPQGSRPSGPREERGYASEAPARRASGRESEPGYDRPLERAPRERDEGYRVERPHDGGRGPREDRPRYDDRPRREGAPRQEPAARDEQAPRHDDARRGGYRQDEPRREERPRHEERPHHGDRPRHGDRPAHSGSRHREEPSRAQHEDRPRHGGQGQGGQSYGGGQGHDRPARGPEDRGELRRTHEPRRGDSSSFGGGVHERQEPRRSEAPRRAPEREMPREAPREPKRERRVEADDSGFGAGI